MKKFVNEQGFTHVELIFIVIVLAIIGLIGSMVYQNQADKNYNSKIQLAYSQQAMQMQKLYDSFSLPVFASNNSDSSSDDKDLATINQEIGQATQLTNKLKVANNVVVLPLVTNSKTKTQHRAMAQYINDSTAFLQQYQKLATYTKGLEKVLNDLGGAGTAFAQLQTATSLQEVKDQLNNNSALDFLKPSEELSQLSPPIDLKNTHEKLLSTTNNLQKDIADLSLDINSCGSQSLIGDCQSLITTLQKISGPDSSALATLSNYDLAGNLQHGSWLHNQILKLEAEKPLTAN